MLLSIAKCAYNNAKNASTCYNSFKLNFSYYPKISFKEDTDSYFKFKSADKVLPGLWELMIVCYKNIYHTQKLQNRAHNKDVKPRNHIPNDKVWLNGKYIKTKQNRKLEIKFFKLFEILYSVGK